MKLPKIDNIRIIGLLFTTVLVFFYVILGSGGMMTVLGIGLFFVLPFYLILDNFGFKQDEKLIFSFMLGVGLFPSVVYWLAIFISLRISILITFIFYIAVAYYLKKVTRKPQKNTNNGI